MLTVYDLENIEEPDFWRVFGIDTITLSSI